MSKQSKNGRKKPVKIPNEDKLIHIRIFNRKSGRLELGKYEDKSSWKATPEDVVRKVKEKIDSLTASRHTASADIQIHVKPYNKKGEVKDDEKWSGPASSFSNYVEKYVNKVNS